MHNIKLSECHACMTCSRTNMRKSICRLAAVLEYTWSTSWGVKVRGMLSTSLDRKQTKNTYTGYVTMNHRDQWCFTVKTGRTSAFDKICLFSKTCFFCAQIKSWQKGIAWCILLGMCNRHVIEDEKRNWDWQRHSTRTRDAYTNLSRLVSLSEVCAWLRYEVDECVSYPTCQHLRHSGETLFQCFNVAFPIQSY